MKPFGQFFVLLSLGVCSVCSISNASTTNTALTVKASSYSKDGNSVIVYNAAGTHVRITPYGDAMLRLQSARQGEAYFADDHYEMVASHHMGGSLSVQDQGNVIVISTKGKHPLHVNIDKQSLAVSYFTNGNSVPVLVEDGSVAWQDNLINRPFVYDASEHFTGLGHSYFGRSQALDLQGQATARNYGAVPIEQAPLVVPFYISSKGYGIFLNSTFKNHFNFGQDQHYVFGIDTRGFAGRMDYFFIAGPEPKDVLRHYVELTGKPRLPSKAMFGLALSDKAQDHNSATPSDEVWWKQKIADHRAAGFPLDHVVNDNRWRAGGGQRCVSRIEWDKGRYPNPAEYATWLKQNGLVTTIDFNRCVAQYSEGWRAEFNLPEVGNIEFSHSAPDMTNPDFRTWFWHIMAAKALDPKLHYPGDALWIDEFDEEGGAPEKMILANGLSSAEMRNYWFFLIAKSLVQEGWDKANLNKRPYVWVRGMTAGAQRYATLWSGDIKPNFDEMKLQIRGMQMAGLSGFPFWGHDAGGFYDWDAQKGPDADLYRKWSMGFGSFSPIWKPHGMGMSRWPLDRSAPEQAAAHQFSQARYELMPYLYSAAHEAATTGLPMARAMLLEYPHDAKAWQYDLQYMWGADLLVAPVTSADQAQEVWLPAGTWINYWHPEQQIKGDQILKLEAGGDLLPVYVKAGAILTKRKFALSTAFADKSLLVLDVYRGADGKTELIEDDDVSEAYRLKHQFMTTTISYQDAGALLQINAAKGSYAQAPSQRGYQITLHGSIDSDCFTVNGKPLTVTQSADKQTTQMTLPRVSIRQAVTIRACKA